MYLYKSFVEGENQDKYILVFWASSRTSEESIRMQISTTCLRDNPKFTVKNCKYRALAEEWGRKIPDGYVCIDAIEVGEFIDLFLAIIYLVIIHLQGF